MRSISDVFKELDKEMTGEIITFRKLLEVLHERGFGFLLLIFATPMALPIPVPPGINILLASPLVLLTAQQAMGRHTIWMPEWLLNKSLKCKTMSSIIKATMPWLLRLEKLVKPRFEFITKGIFSYIIGVMGLIMALCVCIPIPGTNTIPSLGIALMAVGVIMRDGLAVITGALIGIGWITLLYFLGTEALDIVSQAIKSYI